MKKSISKGIDFFFAHIYHDHHIKKHASWKTTFFGLSLHSLNRLHPMSMSTSIEMGGTDRDGFRFLPLRSLFTSLKLSISFFLLFFLSVNISLAKPFVGDFDAAPLACPDDTEGPIFNNCPSDQVLPFNQSICGAIVTWDDIVLTDNCDSNPTFSGNYESGDILLNPNTLITIIAVDSTGNKTTCEFSVQVKGDTGIELTCPENITLNANDTCTAIGQWDLPSTLNPCNTITNLTSNYQSGHLFKGTGNYGVIYTLANTFLDTTKCSFNVVVKDSSPPLIFGCALDTTLYTKGTGCEVAYTWTDPIPMDNCNDVVLGPPNFDNGYAFPLGKTTVKYTALDGAGLTGQCSFKVTVLDTVPPVVSFCPENITVVVASGCDTTVNWETPLFVDGCDASPTITQSHMSGQTFNTGIHEVIYTAVDIKGNQRKCAFSITVKDNMIPTMTSCPNDTIIYVGQGCEAVYNYTMPTAMDGCDGMITPIANPSNTTFTAGIHTVEITASDSGGNMVSCSFTVTAKDTIPPTTTCPSGISINADGTIISDPDDIIDHIEMTSCDKPIVYFDFPPILDNCSAEITDPTMLVDSFSVGVSNHTYNFKDPFGNGGACGFSVYVEGSHEAIVIMADATSVCPGGEVTLLSSVTDLGAVFHWTGPGGYVSNEPAPTIEDFSFAKAGKYFLTVDINGCSFEPVDSLDVRVAEDITANADAFTVPINVSAMPLDITSNDAFHEQLTNVTITTAASNGSVYEGGGKLFYTPTAGYVGSDQVIYEVCVKDCPTICSSAIVNIDVDLGSAGDVCIIPNYVSPNGDGINDELILACIAGGENQSKILIYNQWGGLVFEESPYLNNWRGDMNGDSGNPLPDGTYYYIFWKDKNQTPQKGYITIYR